MSRVVHFPHLSGDVLGTSIGLLDLSGITVILGKNGSGKSLLLRGIRDANQDSCHYIAPERAGAITLVPALAQGQLSAAQRRSLSQYNLVANYHQQVVSRIQSYFTVRGNHRGAELPVHPSELEGFAPLLLPEFELKLDAQNPPFVLTHNSGRLIQDVNELSSGESQLFSVCLDILTMGAIWEIQGPDRRLMLIDEPDAHVHPDLQQRFAEFVMRVSDRFKFQAIVATHSTSLLAAFGMHGDQEVGVINLRQGETQYRAERFDKYKKELASVLGGHVLMGALFGAPLMLVEGDDDFKIWSQVPRHHVVDLAVLPCNGDEIKQYQRSLETVFGALMGSSGPVGYALLDGDATLPEPSEHSPQTYVRFLQLNCRESENLYLTKEVLTDLGLTWPEAVGRLKARADECGNKAHRLREPERWDRSKEDFKGIIGEIARILDDKGVDWAIRVGQCIGRSKPTGQLAGFLGSGVLAALWPSQEGAR